MMKLLHQPLLLTFIEVCHTSGSQTWLTNFCSSCMQSQCFSMLSVVYSSGVSRATLSCSLRPSARSSSSQTSSPSPPILMSCMRVPKISLEDRCVLTSMTLSLFLPVHHHHDLVHTDSLPSVTVWFQSAFSWF